MNKKVRGWATLKAAIKLLCRVLGRYFAQIEPRVTNPEHRQRLENLRNAVEAICAVIDLFDFAGDGIGQS